jgi:hypothetical protein
VRNLWEFTDPKGQPAPNLLNEAPRDPLSITKLIQRLDDKQNVHLQAWLELLDEQQAVQNRPVALVPATAADVEKEHTMLYKEWQVNNAM